MSIIMFLALFLYLIFSTFWYVGDRANATFRLFAHSTAQRIVAIVELMETTAPTDRYRLLAGFNSPTLQVGFANTPPPRAQIKPEIEEEIREHLTGLGSREVRIDFQGGRGFPRRGSFDQRGDGQPDLLPSRRKALISVALRTDEWLVFTVSTEMTSFRWAARTAFWLGFGGLVIALFALFASRRVTRPIRRFADAADRMGVDMTHAPPLPETGSRELRSAAQAFNRMQDRLRRYVEDRTQMIAAISHDLRTALTRLQLRAEFIDDDEQRKKAEADLEEMKAMLESTLSFAREDALSEGRASLDLAALVRTLADDLSDAGQDVSCDGADRLVMDGRPKALRRAFANLIDNAVRYGGGARIEISQTDGEATVRIDDDGPGIPEDRLDQVFQPFYRLETSRNRDTGGTGLGLALARTIVRAHGGDIDLQNLQGGGLRVSVVLPITQ